jgi:hypothetical protein
VTCVDPVAKLKDDGAPGFEWVRHLKRWYWAMHGAGRSNTTL